MKIREERNAVFAKWELPVLNGFAYFMKKEIFRGCATALVTPFSDGKIDYAALEELIKRQISGGVGGLVVGGTTGEAATLSDRERYTLFEFSAERVNKKVPLIFGTGTNDTRLAIAHTKAASRIGCDAVLVVTPYYNKGTEEGVYRHYMEIAEATELPVILYNVPSRTGVNLGLGLLERLAECEKIVGIKEASDSQDRLVSLAAFGDKLPLIAGNDSQLYSVLALGGVGVISVVSNLYPEKICSIYNSFSKGNLAAALAEQTALLPLIRALFEETNPSPLKHAMSLLGLCKNEVRLPLYTPRESTKEMLKRLILD